VSSAGIHRNFEELKCRHVMDSGDESISHSKKNSPRYCHTYTLVFM